MNMKNARTQDIGRTQDAESFMSSASSASSSSSESSGVVDCPGLKRPRNAVPSWTDSAGTVHDLAAARTLTLDEVAATPELVDVGFGSYDAVRELVTSGRLYPVFRKNSRVIRVFACGVADFRRRQLGAAPIRHLAETRAARVA